MLACRFYVRFVNLSSNDKPAGQFDGPNFQFFLPLKRQHIQASKHNYLFGRFSHVRTQKFKKPEFDVNLISPIYSLHSEGIWNLSIFSLSFQISTFDNRNKEIFPMELRHGGHAPCPDTLPPEDHHPSPLHLPPHRGQRSCGLWTS